MIFLETFSQGFSICKFDYGEGWECRTCSVEIGPEIEANGRLLSYLEYVLESLLARKPGDCKSRRS